jgi:hypothetical protein
MRSDDHSSAHRTYTTRVISPSHPLTLTRMQCPKRRWNATGTDYSTMVVVGLASSVRPSIGSSADVSVQPPAQPTLDSFCRSCARGSAQPREPTTHIPKARLMRGERLSLLSCPRPPWLADVGLKPRH